MTENTRVCPFCGAKNPSEARFCGYCGGPMEGAGYKPPTAALPDDPQPAGTPLPPPSLFDQQPLPPVTPPPAAGTPIPPPPYSPPHGAPVQPPMPKRNNNFLIPIIVIVLLACAMCACVTMVLVFNFSTGGRGRSNLPSGLPLPVEITPGAIQIPEIKLTPEVQITLVAPEEIQTTAEAIATQVAEGLGTLTAPQGESTQPTAEAGAQATPTDQGTASGMKVFTHNNVTFAYDKSLAADIQAQTVPESNDQNMPPWEIYPKHDEYTLQGYPLQGNMHQPQVFIFPVAEYSQLSPEAQKRIDALKSVLKTRPADVKSGGVMPFLPFWNAGPVVVVQVKYFDNGVRFVTKFGQDVSPVTNQSLFYTYQGFSSDGKYYIAAILPVSTDLLPDTSNLSGADYDQFIKDFGKYIADLAAKLNGAQPAGFSPNLNLLDDFAQSIQVQ